jgi:hypothetical protein
MSEDAKEVEKFLYYDVCSGRHIFECVDMFRKHNPTWDNERINKAFSDCFDNSKLVHW